VGVGFQWVDQVGSSWPEELMSKYNLVPQGISAEMIADQWEIPRSELDEIGMRSHQLAAQATEEGRFEREIVPFSVNGDTYVTDQGIRPDTNLEALSQLKPAFKEDGKVTAGNSSQISDGAAAVLLMERSKAESLGLKPRARILDQTTVGVDPVIMLTGPIPATKRLLERNGMTANDVDLFEINEAFSSVVAAWRREVDPDWDRVNVNGGALALGHPLGSSGARLITTAFRALAGAGYHVLAPDMRGYGESSAPEAIDAYDVVSLADDIAGLLDDIGARRAAIVGHDWGANVAWHFALFHPERTACVAGISVP